MQQQKCMNFYQKDLKLRKTFSRKGFTNTSTGNVSIVSMGSCETCIISFITSKFTINFWYRSKISLSRYFSAEILRNILRRKTLCNQSINQSRYFSTVDLFVPIWFMCLFMCFSISYYLLTYEHTYICWIDFSRRHRNSWLFIEC